MDIEKLIETYLNFVQFWYRKESLKSNPGYKFIAAKCLPLFIHVLIEISCWTFKVSFEVVDEIPTRKLVCKTPHFEVFVQGCKAGEIEEQSNHVEASENQAVKQTKADKYVHFRPHF